MYDSSNVFAKVLAGDIPSNKVYEDDHVYAFHDISPAAPTHVLVIPKGEYISYDDFVQKADAQTIAHFFKTVQSIADSLGVVESGYRLITNHGANASQTVPHFHVHIVAGKQLGGLIPSDKEVR